MDRLKVWDTPTVLTNWLIGIFFVLSYVTVGAQANVFSWHLLFLAVLMAGVAFRTFWGIFGPEPVRFSNMLMSLPSAFLQVSDLFAFRRQSWPGHSPLSGLFSVLMLGLMWFCVITGFFSVNIDSSNWIAAIFSILPNQGLTTLHQKVMNFTGAYYMVYGLVTLFFVIADGGGLRRFLFGGEKFLFVVPAKTHNLLRPRNTNAGVVAAGLVCSLALVVMIPTIQDLRNQIDPTAATAARIANSLPVEAQKPAVVVPPTTTATATVAPTASDLANIAPAAGSENLADPSVILLQLDPETGTLKRAHQ